MKAPRPWSALTTRDRTERVRPLLAQGLSHSVIAHRLGIKPHAVAYVAALIRKAAITAAAHAAIKPPAKDAPAAGMKPAERTWAQMQEPERRDVLQWLIGEGFGLDDVAARYRCTGDEVRATLADTFRRAAPTDAEIEAPEETLMDLPASLPVTAPVPLASTWAPPQPWSAMTLEERQAAVKEASGAGLSVKEIARKFQIRNGLVEGVARSMRQAGALAETRGRQSIRRLLPAKATRPGEQRPPNPEAKASTDNGATGRRAYAEPSTGVTGDASRPIVGGGTGEGDGRDVQASGGAASVTSNSPAPTIASTWAGMSRAERDDAALTFRRTGLSYTQMSERLGVAKATIASLFRAMEARGIIVPASTLPPVKPRAPCATGPAQRKPAAVRSKLASAPPAAPREGVTTKLPWKPRARAASELAARPAEPLTLLDITEMTCRWPVGPGTGVHARFCGAGCPFDEPYCGEHMARAYTPAAQRRPAAPAAAARDTCAAPPTSPWSM